MMEFIADYMPIAFDLMIYVSIGFLVFLLLYLLPAQEEKKEKRRAWLSIALDVLLSIPFSLAVFYMVYNGAIFSIFAIFFLFALIIGIHELGHYIAAKACGVYVESFSLGFGPVIFSKEDKSGCLWALRAIPIGGSCMMKGEEKHVDDSDAFCNKRPIQRAVILFAGPLFNLVLAYLIGTIIVTAFGYTDTTFSVINERTPAYFTGMTNSDRPILVDGKTYDFGSELSSVIMYRKSKDMNIVFEHGDRIIDTSITPYYDEDAKREILGVKILDTVYPKGFDIFNYGMAQTQYYAVNSIKPFIVPARQKVEVSGPIGIVRMIFSELSPSDKENTDKEESKDKIRPRAPAVEEESVSYVTRVQSFLVTLFSLAVLLSSSIGIMNLLPFPALDGGRLVMTLAEQFTGKRLSYEMEMKINKLGLSALLIMIAVISVHDFVSILADL